VSRSSGRICITLPEGEGNRTSLKRGITTTEKKEKGVISFPLEKKSDFVFEGEGDFGGKIVRGKRTWKRTYILFKKGHAYHTIYYAKVKGGGGGNPKKVFLQIKSTRERHTAINPGRQGRLPFNQWKPALVGRKGGGRSFVLGRGGSGYSLILGSRKRVRALFLW